MENKEKANIFYMYYQIIKKYKIYMEVNLEAYNFSPAQLDVLTFLINNRNQDVTATMIGQYRGVSKGLISKAVNELEDKKIIKVSQSKKDKRVNLLTIEDFSSRQIQEIKKYNDEFIDNLIKDLSYEDLLNFNRISLIMMDNVGRIE